MRRIVSLSLVTTGLVLSLLYQDVCATPPFCIPDKVWNGKREGGHGTNHIITRNGDGRSPWLFRR